MLSPSRPPTAFAPSSAASSAPSASEGSRPRRARPSRLGGSRGQGGIQRAAEPVIMQWACQMVNRYALHTSQTYITLIGKKTENYLFIEEGRACKNVFNFLGGSYLKGRGSVGRARHVVAVHLPVAHICCCVPRQGVVQPVHVHRVVHDAPVGHRPDGAGVGPAVLEQQRRGEALLWLLVTLCLVSHVIHGSPVRSRSLGPHP